MKFEMDENKPFEDRLVRVNWNLSNQMWYFVISDVVHAITKTRDPKDYLKKMRKHDKELSQVWGQIVTPLNIETSSGKHFLNCSNAQGLLRIILSIPSPKAKPIKHWIRNIVLEKFEQFESNSFNKPLDLRSKKLLSNPEKWIEKRKRIISYSEELYLQGKMSDLELVLAMLGDESLMNSFERADSKKMRQNNSDAKEGVNFFKDTEKHTYVKFRKKTVMNKMYLLNPIR